MPARFDDMNTAIATPATMPKTVPIGRLCVKSPSGPPSETCPDSTIAASVSASTVAVGSLNADSAITVCATLGRRRRRSKSGIRIAGSVAASTAPISSATSNADVEERRHHEGDEHRREQHAGEHQQPEADRRAREHAQRDLRCRRGRG